MLVLIFICIVRRVYFLKLKAVTELKAISKNYTCDSIKQTSEKRTALEPSFLHLVPPVLPIIMTTFEIVSHYVVQAYLKLRILLQGPSVCRMQACTTTLG